MQHQQQSSKKNKVLMDVDANDPKLRAFFKSISKNLKVDESKLHNMCNDVFMELGDSIFAIIKKAFGNFRMSADFR